MHWILVFLKRGKEFFLLRQKKELNLNDSCQVKKDIRIFGSGDVDQYADDI